MNIKSLFATSGIAILLCSAGCSADTFTDPRDGQKYKTTEIDGVTWFAQNLNYETDNSMCYDNNLKNCKKYGRLYSSAEGACPEGWRVGFPKVKNRELQARNAGWRQDVTYHDQYGFSALPGGFYGQKVVFQNQSGTWVAVKDDPSFFGMGSVAVFYESNWYGFGSRPIDDLEVFPEASSGITIEDGYRYMALSIRCYDASKEIAEERAKEEARQAKIKEREAKQKAEEAEKEAERQRLEVERQRLKAEKDAERQRLKAEKAERQRLETEKQRQLAKMTGSFRDKKNGRVYATIQIGEQIWMKKNLNIETPYSWCYEDNPENCEKYGRLYMWDAAMEACPAGWHLPSEMEWKTLFETIGGTGSAGTKLKSKFGWENGGNGQDSYDFSVLPAGGRDYYGVFGTAGNSAYFWSSAEYGSFQAYLWCFYYSDAGVDEAYRSKYLAFSVRCVMN